MVKRAKENTHVSGVLGSLVLGGVSDHSLVIGESNPRRGDSVSLVVGNDFHSSRSLNTVCRWERKKGKGGEQCLIQIMLKANKGRGKDKPNTGVGSLTMRKGEKVREKMAGFKRRKKSEMETEHTPKSIPRKT